MVVEVKFNPNYWTKRLCSLSVQLSSEGLLEDFLSACRSHGSPTRAVELVQLSAAFCLSATGRLAKQALEFDLTEEQR